MKWEEFYAKYTDMTNRERRLAIESLANIGSSEEICDSAVFIDHEPTKMLLVSKAVELGCVFSHIDFCRLSGELSDVSLARIIRRANITFGSSDEVTDTLESILNRKVNDELYKRAVKAGVIFTKAQLERLGRRSGLSLHQREIDEAQATDKPGFFSVLSILLDSTGSDKKKYHGQCDGNCASCPAHYGYRYGRWYYGHGHHYGCEYGGNGGADGKTNRD